MICAIFITIILLKTVDITLLPNKYHLHHGLIMFKYRIDCQLSATTEEFVVKNAYSKKKRDK